MKTDRKKNSGSQPSDTADYTAPLQNGVSDDRVYRQFVAQSSTGSEDNLGVLSGQVTEVIGMFQNKEETPVQDRSVKLPLSLRILSGIFTAALIITCFGIFLWDPTGQAVAAFAVCAVIRALLGWLCARIEKHDWLRRVEPGAEQRKTQLPVRRILTIGGIAVGALAVLTAITLLLGSYLTPTEATDGPPVADMDMDAFWEYGQIYINSGANRFYPGLVSAAAFSENRIYYIYEGTLYSIDADYSDQMRIAGNVLAYTGDKLPTRGSYGEALSPIIVQDGYVWYLRQSQVSQKTTLWRFTCGSKRACEKLSAGDYDILGLREDGTLICYSWDSQAEVWQEAAQFPTG